MNKRQNILLQSLVNIADERQKTIAAYAEMFEVSEQTIRNDIKTINDTLQANNQSSVELIESGKINVKTPIDLAFLGKHDYYTYKFSPRERKTILTMILLNLDSHTTVSELSKNLLVSRNTLLNDMEDLKQWFKENKLTLISQTGKGVSISGNEIYIRQGMLKLLSLNHSVFENDEYLKTDIFHVLLMQDLNKNDELSVIKQAVKKAETDNDIYLTDFSYQEICSYLLIMVNRLSKHKHLKANESPTWESVSKSSKIKFASSIWENLKQTFSIPESREELILIIEQLRSKSYIKNNAPSMDTIDIQILINEFIYKLSNSIGINFYLDFYLYELLLTHMKTVAYRLKQHHSLKNPLLSQMESEYGDLFDKIEQHLKPIEVYMKCKVSRDEVAFIGMYILAILEENIADDSPINTLLVCNSGRGTAQLILAKVSSLFPQLRIVQILSSHQISKEALDKIDLVLTTVPLKDIQTPCQQVSPILSDIDVSNIQKLVFEILKGKRKGSLKQKQAKPKQSPVITQLDHEVLKKGIPLRDLLSEDMILLEGSADSWQDAVTTAGNLLYQNGIVEKRYINEMIHNIETNGPYVVIYPSIAIPHADHSAGSIKPGASIVRFREPITFYHEENDPVTIVIAFSVIDSNSIGRALYNLTNMLTNKNFLYELETAKTNKALLQVINKFEREIDNIKR